MQQARSDHFVLAKLRRDVLKHGVAVGLRYGFGGLHQPVEFVSGQSQSQLVQWGHGKCSAKNKNAATGLWFSDCISPFRRMHPRARHAVDPAPGAAKAAFSCSRASFWQRPPSPFRAQPQRHATDGGGHHGKEDGSTRPRLAASCGFRPSIRLTRCIGLAGC
jgi:hypothetical protein